MDAFADLIEYVNVEARRALVAPFRVDATLVGIGRVTLIRDDWGVWAVEQHSPFDAAWDHIVIYYRNKVH